VCHAALAVAAALVLAPPASGAGAVDGDTVAAWIRRAETSGLARHPSWRALLHYERRRLPPRDASVARDDALFLHEAGRHDPAAELAATLRGLADPARRSARGEPVRCSFPARARWLADALDLPDGAWPRPPCPELARWRGRLHPRALTLIFPESFLGSPASMFGHTLLRLDASPEPGAADLLDYAVDFTADTGGDQGPVYLLKGVLGRYPARFALSPYWEKLAQYAEWQSRDVWEYRLDLSPEEIELVLLHLWELRGVTFPYWFFDENCSHHLVRLLQIARPGIRLEHGFPIGVIPVDTVRDVLADVPLRGEPRYRPSPATGLRHAVGTEDPAVVRAFLALAHGRMAPDDPALAELPVAARARALDLAYDALRHRFVRSEVSADASRRAAHRLLLARSRLGVGAESRVTPPRPAVPPHLGHGTAMASLAAGVEEGESFVDLRHRPALHGLLDPGGGHGADAAIHVLDTTLRWYPAEGRVRLHELVALEVRSQTPRDAFFRPVSWHGSTGLRTRLRPESDGDLDPEPVWRTEAGVGGTWALADWARVSLFAELRNETGGTLDENVAFGPGGAVDLRLGRPASAWQTRVRARAHRFVLGDAATVLRAELTQRWALSRHVALVAGAAWNRDEGQAWWDGRLALRFYY